MHRVSGVVFGYFQTVPVSIQEAEAAAHIGKPQPTGLVLAQGAERFGINANEV